MERLNRICLAISAGALLGIMGVAVLNMILRPLGHPITGGFEIMGYGSALVTGLGLGYSWESKSHIAVDILFKKFPQPLQLVLSVVGKLVSAFFFFAVAWKMFLMAEGYRQSGELSETLRFPYYPITFLAGFGIASFGLNILWSAIREIKAARRS